MYTEDSIERINRIPINEVVARFIKVERAGSGYDACCPFHSERTPSFKLDVAKGIFKCFGCGESGDVLQFLMKKNDWKLPEAVKWASENFKINVEETQEEKKKEYTKPVWKNNTSLPDWAIKWFENRKLSQKTVERFKVTTAIEWMPQDKAEVNTIQFNYFKDNILTNIKSRTGTKGFKLVSGAELIFYNLDSLTGATECYIVEGEPDAIALAEAGYWKEGTAVVSVPNGATQYKNNLEYVDNCIDLFNNITKIHLALDNDANGRKLREDLAERFGKDRCDYIDFMDQKDANDVLKVYGIQGVINCCSNPQEFPLEGAFTISEFSDEIDDMYDNGLEKGVRTGLAGFEMSFVPGYITVITGIPSHGKSSFVDDIALRLIIKRGWKGAFYSPENKPTKLHFATMAQRIIGKDWDGKSRMTKEEMKSVKEYLQNKAWFIKMDKGLTLEAILVKIKELKKRHGISFFVIDAWNKLEHKGGNDLSYIGRSLDELSTFCEFHQIHCFLVAHPTKIEKEKKTPGKYMVPTMYNISGSADFFNKADNGICVYRDFDGEGKSLGTTIYRQKIKFRHWGFPGRSDYQYDQPSGRYFVEGCPDYTNWLTGKVNIDRVNEVQANTVEDINSPPVITADNSDLDDLF